MTFSKALLAAGAVALSLTAGAAAAHHSFAMFDKTKLLTFKGSVYAIEFKNPHSWFWFKFPVAVDPAQSWGLGGEIQLWGLEGGGTGAFTQQGIKKSDIPVGAEVTVDLHPLRNGQHGGQFLRVTFADGRQVGSLQTATDRFREQGLIK